MDRKNLWNLVFQTLLVSAVFFGSCHKGLCGQESDKLETLRNKLPDYKISEHFAEVREAVWLKDYKKAKSLIKSPPDLAKNPRIAQSLLHRFEQEEKRHQPFYALASGNVKKIKEARDELQKGFSLLPDWNAFNDAMVLAALELRLGEIENALDILELLIQWDRTVKDLTNIPNSEIMDCLIVDDNPDYIVDSQVSQWIQIEKYSSPYAKTDRELERVQALIESRLA